MSQQEEKSLPSSLSDMTPRVQFVLLHLTRNGPVVELVLVDVQVWVVDVELVLVVFVELAQVKFLLWEL